MKKYVSDIQLAAKYGVSRSTVWRWQASGRLPRPVQLSPGCTRWVLDEIEAHDAQLQATRTTQAA